jgi:hypothetical protein
MIMKTIIICPEHRPAGGIFQRMKPLALMPVLGRTVLDRALEQIKKNGHSEVLILASDRPDVIRASVGKGQKWGLNIEVIATASDLPVDLAELEYGRRPAGAPRAKVMLLDAPSIPSNQSLWQTHFATFSSLLSTLTSPESAPTLTMQEVSQGVWISTKARVSNKAEITGPAWIGPHAFVRDGAKIGPNVIIEAGAYIDSRVSVQESWIGPATYVGADTHIAESFAWGNGLLKWSDGSFLEVKDAFLLNDLTRSSTSDSRAGWIERLGALLLMVITAPLAFFVMLRSRLRDQAVFSEKRVILPPPHQVNTFTRTHGLLSLNNANGWLSRWPELLSVVLGRMALVGNRPLSLEEITALRGSLGQLWLGSPAGVISLADAEGANGDVLSESLAHAAYFTSKRTRTLRIRIFLKCLCRLASRPIPSSPLPLSA